MSRVALVLLGAYLCVVGAVVHRHLLEVAGTSVPWGLLLALVATFAVATAAGRFVPLGGAWIGLGWTTTLLLQEAVSGGSVVVAGDARGWGFMLGGLAVLAVAVVRAPRAL